MLGVCLQKLAELDEAMEASTSTWAIQKVGSDFQ